MITAEEKDLLCQVLSKLSNTEVKEVHPEFFFPGCGLTLAEATYQNKFTDKNDLLLRAIDMNFLEVSFAISKDNPRRLFIARFANN